MSKLSDFFRSCPIPNTPISEEDARDMHAMMMSSEFMEPWTFDEFQQKMIGEGKMFKDKDEMHQGLWVIWSRSKMLDDYFKMTLGATLFLSLFVKTVGDAAMYFSYVAGKAKSYGIRVITLDFIVKNVFQFGVFSPEQISLMWILQEEDGKNLIDKGDEWREFLYGESAGKIAVRFTEDDYKLMATEDVLKEGVVDAREIEGRMFFWMGKNYVSTSLEDYSKL
jgi:hypothetical protein